MITTDFFNIQTPALLFPAVSLLMLAYTNRFFGITSVIRKLHADMSNNTTDHNFYLVQIKSLSERINLIIWAQKTGIVSLISCVLSMIAIFFETHVSLGLFGIALCSMSASLLFIFKELAVSQEALNYILNDCTRIDNERKEKANINPA